MDLAINVGLARELLVALVVTSTTLPLRAVLVTNTDHAFAHVLGAEQSSGAILRGSTRCGLTDTFI